MFDLTMILLSLPGILLGLTLHEFSHGYAAYLLGDPTAKMMGRLTLNPLKHLDLMGTVLIIFTRIGWAKPVPVNPANFRHPARDMALTSLAGPLSNLLLAGILGLAFRVLHPFLASASWWINMMAPMLVIAVIINIILAFFNLLPIPPLDGFAIASFFFPKLRYSTGFIRWGPYVLIALIALGFFLPVSPLGLYLSPFVWIGTYLFLGFPLGLYGG